MLIGGLEASLGRAVLKLTQEMGIAPDKPKTLFPSTGSILFNPDRTGGGSTENVGFPEGVSILKPIGLPGPQTYGRRLSTENFIPHSYTSADLMGGGFAPHPFYNPYPLVRLKIPIS